MTDSNHQTKQNISDHGCNKNRLVYSKGRECPGSEKTALNYEREVGVSQPEENCEFEHEL